MYHAVGGKALNDLTGTYSLSKTHFDLHVAALEAMRSKGLLVPVPFGTYHPRGVTITFDDGYRDSVEAAQQIAARGFFVTVFVITSRVGTTPEFVSASELRDLSAHPRITIGAHGESHQRLCSLHTPKLREELVRSRDFLAEIFGRVVETMSYPHGSYDSRVLAEVEAAGYRWAATSRCGFYRLNSPPLEIPRLDVWSGDSATNLCDLLSGACNYLGWNARWS